MSIFSNIKSLSSAKKGFTLIELLIVIAVLGILAAVVLVAIDPVQQLARGEDGGRKTAIGQLGRSAQAYYTANSQYPPAASWTFGNNVLVDTGEIKTFPANPGYPADAVWNCNNNGFPNVRGYCYKIGAGTPPEVIIYARMESNSENSKCTSPDLGWFVFSSQQGRSGLVCAANDAGALDPDAITFQP